jgi:hypothetical protein
MVCDVLPTFLQEPCEGDVTVRVPAAPNQLMCPYDCSSKLSRDNVCSVPAEANATAAGDPSAALVAAVCTCGNAYAGRFCNTRKAALRDSEWAVGEIGESGRRCFAADVASAVAANSTILVQLEVCCFKWRAERLGASKDVCMLQIDLCRSSYACQTNVLDSILIRETNNVWIFAPGA